MGQLRGQKRKRDLALETLARIGHKRKCDG
jgi:hypothetical protein